LQREPRKKKRKRKKKEEKKTRAGNARYVFTDFRGKTGHSAGGTEAGMPDLPGVEAGEEGKRKGEGRGGGREGGKKIGGAAVPCSVLLNAFVVNTDVGRLGGSRERIHEEVNGKGGKGGGKRRGGRG